VLGGARLRATDRQTDQRLGALVVAAAAGREDPVTPMSVAMQREARLPLRIRAICLNNIDQRTPTSANVLLLAQDPELRREAPPEMLMQAFGLTAAEADVAIRIASGKTLTEIAVDRGVTISTVRVLWKRVLKTFTHGQAQLTSMTARLAFLSQQAEGPVSPHDRGSGKL
jgi:DNA-binding CsgD family transcriptional regulator